MPTDMGQPAAPGQEGTCGSGSPQIALGQVAVPRHLQRHPVGCTGWAQNAATEVQWLQTSEKPHEKPQKWYNTDHPLAVLNYSRDLIEPPDNGIRTGTLWGASLSY